MEETKVTKKQSSHGFRAFFKNKKENRTAIRWVLYDVGNSAFTMIACSLFAIFFQNLVNNAMGASNEATAYGNSIYALVTSLITLLSVILEPLFGTLSDFKGNRKPLFLIFSLTGVVTCIALGLEMHYIIWLVILVVAKLVYNGALMIYDSMLVDVTTEDKVDEVSTFGYALGYIGSCVPFLIGVAIVAFGFTNFNLGPGEEAGMAHSLTVPWGYLICFIINALWWLTFTIPLFKDYKQKYGLEREHNVGRTIVESYKRIGRTFKKGRENKGILLFLLAFFFYIDAVYSIIDLAMKISTSLGVDQVQALIALVAVQFIAFPACLVIAKLSKKVRTDYLILACIGGYLFISIFAIFITANWMFWVLAVCVGFFQGGIQSMSRSYLTKIIDKKDSGEWFSLYDTFGKGAAFLGTLLYGLINGAASTSSDSFIKDHSSNFGIIPLSVLVLIGGIIFFIAMKINAPKLNKKNNEESVTEGAPIETINEENSKPINSENNETITTENTDNNQENQ